MHLAYIIGQILPMRFAARFVLVLCAIVFVGRGGSSLEAAESQPQPRSNEGLQLGSLDQAHTQLQDSLASFGQSQADRNKVGISRLTPLNSRRVPNHRQPGANQNLQQISNETRGPISRRQEEVPSTDCVGKKNEILSRQSVTPATSSTRAPVAFGLPGYQRLRPKHDNLAANPPSNSPSINETNLAATSFHDGEHIPNCNAQGGYEPVQCHKIGYCWCVNKYGQAIKNSAVMVGEDLYCPASLYESESNDLVVVAGISAQRIRNLLRPGMGSSSTESTTANGNINFEADSASSTESASSPTSDGLSSELSSQRFASRHRNEPTLPLIPNNCKASRTNAKERAAKQINDSIWVPDCDLESDRLYALKQCHKSKVCWCVDQTTGLPLRTNEPISASRSTVNCTEIKRVHDLSVAQLEAAFKPQPTFYQGSSEFCDTDKRIEFVVSLSNQFRQQISDYMKQNSASSLPTGLISINPFAVDEAQVSKWKFTLMDKDLDGKLGDREWSKFKNNFKLVDKVDEIDYSSKSIHKSSYFSLSPLMILRSQRKCWRDFLEFCGNGELLNDESISPSKWQTCTATPPKSSSDHSERESQMGLSENTYAHSREAAIIRSKKKNPFLGILKPD